jgi:hypothetical protein
MCVKLLSLSKKSKWPIPIILAPLRINNLQATENRKMPGYKFFRQARYFSLVSGDLKSFDMQTISAKIGLTSGLYELI